MAFSTQSLESVFDTDLVQFIPEFALKSGFVALVTFLCFDLFPLSKTRRVVLLHLAVYLVIYWTDVQYNPFKFALKT